MKLGFRKSVVLLFTLGLLIVGQGCQNPVARDSVVEQSTVSKAIAGSPVDKHGALRIANGKILDKNNQAVQLKGMSLFWSQWSGKFWNAQAIGYLADNWKVSLVRAAMGVEEGGYLSNKAGEKAKVITVVDAAIAKGIYVIIDWHDHHALQNKAEAIAFFKEMAQKYGKQPNVLFEIFNEPLDDSWANLKVYAEDVIKAIRDTGSNNIVIVGTRTWSQRVDEAAENPITKYSNVAYTLHYYAAFDPHKQPLRDIAKKAIDKGLTLFVTEFGTCMNDGNGYVDEAESDRWFAFLDQHKISWANWSLNDKNESASALTNNPSGTGPWADNQLTQSGRYIKAKLLGGNGGGNPQVSITSPSNNSQVLPGKVIGISAQATDNGSIKQVQFFVDNVLIGTDTTAPYSINWTSPSAEKTVTVKAVATDNENKTGSASISVIVKKQGGGSVGCAYTKNDWGQGFTANLKITNTGSSPIKNWKLSFNFAGNQKITQGWSATWTQSGTLVNATPVAWNQTIQPGQSIEVGFNASYSGSNANPTNFALTF
jgi:endoglucanase